MSLHDTNKWFLLADNNLFAAKELFKLHRKPLEIICYNCAQATEKLLKGYLVFNNITPDKTHNIIRLLNLCITIDDTFKGVIKECRVLNDYISDVRYPDFPDIDETFTEQVIKMAERVGNIPQILSIREKFISEL
jgi:HEPN domain-containing protein